MSFSAEDAVELAGRLLASGMADDPFARDHGHLLGAVVVHDPRGEQAGWVVPVELDGALLGLIQLEPDGTFRRYASFHGTAESPAGCPRVVDWMDPRVISDRARRLVTRETRLDSPTLSFDRNPDRLAWALRAHSEEAGSFIVFVAGEQAWLAS